MRNCKLIVLSVVLCLLNTFVLGQDWQWLRRTGQPLDASALSSGVHLYADYPTNLEQDRDGNLIMAGTVGKNPDTCRGFHTGGCTADTTTPRKLNAFIAKYNCAGSLVWKKYIGMQSGDPAFSTWLADGANAPRVILSRNKSEIIIFDMVFTGSSQYPTHYNLGDTTLNITVNNNGGLTNVFARLDLNGKVLFSTIAQVTSGTPAGGDYLQNHPMIYAASNGDIIGIANHRPAQSLSPYFRLLNDSVISPIDPSFHGLLPEQLRYAYRMDTLGRLLWARPFLGATSVIWHSMFLDDHDNFTAFCEIDATTSMDTFVLNGVVYKDSIAKPFGYRYYQTVLRIHGDGTFGKVVVPHIGYDKQGFLALDLRLEHSDHEGNSYISTGGRSDLDSILGIRFHKWAIPHNTAFDSLTGLLIKVDTNMQPIWHYNLDDSITYLGSQPDSGTYRVFATGMVGNYGEDRDGHVYVPVIFGPDTFQWKHQRFSVPLPSPAGRIYGREGFAVMDKANADVIGYHLIDNGLQLGGRQGGVKYNGFNHPLVDEQGDFYSANMMEGYQIAAHDTIMSYPGGSDGIDISLVKWGLRCRRDTSLLRPLGMADSLKADGVSTSQIRVRWVDSATYEMGFRIYRSPDGQSAWQLIDSVATGIATYVNGGLPQGAVYYYRVAPINGAGQGSYSNVDSGQTWIQTGISDIDLNGSCKIYPNPATTSVTIEYNTPADDEISIEIYDATGKILYRKFTRMMIGYHQDDIDVSSYAIGCYYVAITGEHTGIRSVMSIVR